VPIIFNAGAYGTYLEWCLTTLTEEIEIVLPLLSDGSSHRFSGTHLLNMSGWHNYVNAGKLAKFVRFHPKVKQEESIKENLETVLSSVEKIICLYPDADSVLLNINNVFDKISKTWWPRSGPMNVLQIENEYQQISDKIYQNWPVDRNTAFDEIPHWIKREFLSLYLMPMWKDQVEWFLPEQFKNSNCQFLFLNDLLYNFENTLENIKQFLNLSFIKEIDQLIPMHKKMLASQLNLGQDLLCNQIVNSCVTDIEFEWAGKYLPLPSESWVQWQLRNLGFEIKCDGLNRFPTNSSELKKLIYTI